LALFPNKIKQSQQYPIYMGQKFPPSIILAVTSEQLISCDIPKFPFLFISTSKQ